MKLLQFVVSISFDYMEGYLAFSVMILGVLLAGKRYPLIKYVCVLLIVIGVALFLFKDVS